MKLILDLTSEELISIEGSNDLLDKCMQNRSYADTLLNSNSSRSHTIFKITVKYAYNNGTNKSFYETSICIVDLAGSERAKRTENVGAQLQEACNINKSLLVLGRCLKAFKDIQSGTGVVAPYRDSKLTKYLFEYFHEENSLRMIVNVNPNPFDFEESMRVLNYAAIAKDIIPIKSKIDNTRKILFLNSSKDQSRAKVFEESHGKIETTSLISNEETLNLRGIFEYPLNENSMDLKGYSKSKLDEKDMKIKVLEGIFFLLNVTQKNF